MDSSVSIECVSVTLSYLALFAVLFLYNYEVMFRWLVLVVAMLGLLFPYIYLLPYFLVFWRVCIGMTVCTERKLYIGVSHESMSDSDLSQSAHHWIVAVKEKKGTYLISHAVGNVISGDGKKKSFTRENDLSKRYSLSHVGYVTRKAHSEMMENLVEGEPMSSGNSCQEYAIDLAFQLSASRTYTFVKTLEISRVRNVIFFALVILSCVLYLQGSLVGKAVNIMVVFNLFLSLELSRIGIHNKKQSAFLPVIRAYFYYPKLRHFAILFLLFCGLVVAHYIKYSFLDTFIFGSGVLALSAVIVSCLIHNT